MRRPFGVAGGSISTLRWLVGNTALLTQLEVYSPKITFGSATAYLWAYVQLELERMATHDSST